MPRLPEFDPAENRIVLERDGMTLVVGDGGDVDLTWADVGALRRQRQWLRGGPEPLPTWALAIVVYILRLFPGARVDPFLPEDDAPEPEPAEADRFRRDTDWDARCRALRERQRQRGPTG
jgi:hypothetical protein